MHPTVALALRFVKRASAANFQREQAGDDERTALAASTPPISDPLAQDYIAWRRAALWIAGVLLSASALLALIERQSTAEAAVVASATAEHRTLSHEELTQGIARLANQLGEGNLAVIDGLSDFLLFVKALVALLVLLAAVRWLRVRGSRSLARWAWLTALVLPLVVSGWPWAQMLDFTHLDRDLGQQGTQLMKQTIAASLAGLLVVTVGPKLLALFPGIMRSSLALKTLLPEAAAPGWLTVVFAPFLAGFLLLVLSVMSQVQGSWLLIGAIVCLVVAPILYVRRAADLVRPHAATEVQAVIGGLRSRASLFNMLGVLLLLVYLFDIDNLSWVTAIHLLLDAGGGILLTMVVISDVTLALLAFSQRQGATFQSSDLRTAYEQRLQSLATAGLTDVESALGIKDLENLRRPTS